MAYVSPRAQLDAAILAGKSDEMDRVANNGLRALRAAASRNVDTGNYIRQTFVVAVPGERGTGRRVTDRLIVADDPGAAAIEWGHLVRVAGARRVRWVPGQRPMRTALESL